jgi:hypothetical protein
MVDLKVAGTFGFAIVVFSLTMATVIFKGAERRNKYSGHGVLNKLFGSGENPV